MGFAWRIYFLGNKNNDYEPTAHKYLPIAPFQCQAASVYLDTDTKLFTEPITGELILAK